jgi:glyoxalase-like protein
VIVTRRTIAAPAELDHLVVGAATLAAGVAFVEQLTGIPPVPGGKHATMGTHNALMRLGERAYLEIIAIDPEGAKPAHPRWFDLDSVALKGELAERPRLIAWAARTREIERASKACPIALGTIRSLERGDYRWRLTVPDDGHRPAKGVVPALIQWDVPAHPAERLPASGISLVQFGATHSDPAPVRAALTALGLEQTLPVSYDRETRLLAMLRTPRGTIAL